MKTTLISIFLLVSTFFYFNANAQILTVYQHDNYKGTTQTFNEGFHKGFFKIVGNDVISSIKIKPGYKVTLYEHGENTGRELVLYSNTPVLSKFNFNDITSNLKVEKVSNTLTAGKSLLAGQRLQSSNGAYILRMQKGDGNLCVYKFANGKQGGFVWGSMKYGFANGRLDMQTDGNLVVYDNAKKARWSSETTGHFNPKWSQSAHKPVKLVLENDGKVNLYNAAGKVVWSNK